MHATSNNGEKSNDGAKSNDSAKSNDGAKSNDSAKSNDEGPEGQRSYRDLAAAIRRLPVDGDMETVRRHLPAGVELTAMDDGFRLKLNTPLPAASLIRAWGLKRVYAVSGDVAQRQWHLTLYKADVDDPYNKRIATERLRLGAWTALVWLAGRPQGKQPNLFAGASPAYGIGPYTSKVVAIRLRK